MSTTLDDVKREVAIANRILAQTGLADGAMASLGHVSMRVPSAPDTFLVKGRGYKVDALALMRPEDMVLCDLEGNKIDGPPGSTQCREVKMHSCIYRARPDVVSITHVHPRFAVLMSVLQATLVPMCQEGTALVRKPLPVYPHSKTIHSEEEGIDVAKLLGDASAILLFGHGVTTVGDNTEKSVMNMLLLEEQAKMNWYAYCAAGPDHPRIPEELIEEGINRTKWTELPHFRDGVAEVGEAATLGGEWDYLEYLVSQDL